MNDIAVITRFHYPENHPDLEWRFRYYRESVLPRLLNQTDDNFDIAIWCEKHHEHWFKDLSPKIKTFQATYAKRDSHLFIDYTPWENVVGLEKYKIQIGLDSDDLVSSNFIEKVRSVCEGCPMKLLVSFQPLKFDVAAGARYKMDQYTEKRGSPIFAYYQPSFEDFKFAYHTSHLRMPLYADKTILVPEGFAEMSIHNLNDSTRIKRTDQKI